MFDERIAFNLPRKWEFIEEKDKDGDKSFKICYNISRNSDGERQAEETYNVMKRQKKGSLVSNVDGNYPVQVVGFAKDFSIGVSVGTSGGSGGYRSSSNSQIKFKIYTGLAVIEYGDSYYLISTMNLGEDDYKSRSEAADAIASELTKVLGFVVLDGDPLKIKPIPKSIILDELKKEDFSLKTIDETPEEREARLEREKKEREARLERERKEREAREKAAAEKRKAEEEARKKAEAEARAREEARKKAEAEAKAKVEAEQKVWEEEAARIKATRKEELEKKRSVIEDDRKKQLDAAAEEKENSLASCEDEIANAEKAGSDMEKELASLGFLAFGKKSELKKSIQANEEKKVSLASKKESILKKYDDLVKAINQKMDQAAQNAMPEIEKKYPIPESPAEKERKRKEAEEAEKRRKELEKAQKEVVNNLTATEDELYYVLDRCYREGGSQCTASEIASLAFGGYLDNHPRTSAAMSLIRKLDKVGLIETSTRKKDGKKVYSLTKLV